MNLEGLLLIFIALLILFLGILMFLKDKKSLINIWYSCLMFFGSLWLFSLFIINYTNNPEIVIFYSRLFYFAVLSTVYSFFNFAFYFSEPNINYNIKYKILTVIPFLCMTYLIFWTDFLIVSVENIEGRQNIILGSAANYFLLFVLVYTMAAIIIWLFRYQESSKIDQVKLKYILIVSAFSFLIAFFFNLFLPVFTWQYIWLAPLAIIIMAILIFYTLAKFKLLNIRLIIMKTIFEGLLILFIIIFFTSSILLTGYFFQDYAEVIRVFVYFIDALIIIIFLDPLKRIWRKSTDFIFYKIKIKINYPEVLKNFNLIMSREIELNNLGKNLVNFLKKELEINKVSLLILNFKNNNIISAPQKKVKFNLTKEITNYCQDHQEIIIRDQLKKEGEEFKKHLKLNNILKELEQKKIDLLIPIIDNNNLIALLFLTEKSSGDIYNDEDIDLFKELRPSIAAAIVKSNLYEKVKELNKELQDKVVDKTKDLKDLNDTLEERNNFLITIQSVINTISQTFNLREATQMIADSIYSQLGYVGGILSFVNEEQKILRVRALTENKKTKNIIKMLKKNPESFFAQLKKGYNLGTKTVLDSEITFSDKMSAYFSPPLKKELINNMQRDLEVKTIIGVPIFSKGKSIGLIHFLFKEERKDISPLDMETMTTLADQVSIISRNLKLYENLQKINKKLQEANIHLRHLDKAKSEFLSIASHQLRTPISSLKGYLSMILDGDYGKIPIKIKRILNGLFESSARLSRTINIFLDVSRIEDGKFHLAKKSTNIDSLIISVLEELKNEAQQKGLQLKYQKSCQKKDLFSLIDSAKIREVILNLIDNALKYTKKGTVLINLICQKKNLKFSVQDKGIGIVAEDLPLLFKKFVRGKGASNIYTGGSGLGLFVAQKIIEDHQGRIWVESKGKNKGSTFSFSLPIYKKVK